MGKFTFDDKLKVVRSYLEGNESYRHIGKRLGIDHKSIVTWVALYKAHGADGLKLRYTNYSAQFKIDVLKFMIETGTSLLETAGIFNISAPSTRKEQMENQLVEDSQEALLKEIDRLKMENAYLKKLNALVQNKEKSPNKIKRK